MKRDVMAPSRHGNTNNQVEESSERGSESRDARRDKQQDQADGVDKMFDKQQISKLYDVNCTQNSAVNNNKQLQLDDKQEINKNSLETSTQREFSGQSQQEISNELEAPKGSKQVVQGKHFPVMDKQVSDINKQSDCYESTRQTPDKQVYKQANSPVVNNQQIIDKQHQEVATHSEEYSDLVITYEQLDDPVIADNYEGECVIDKQSQPVTLNACSTDQLLATHCDNGTPSLAESLTHHVRDVDTLDDMQWTTQPSLPDTTPPPSSMVYSSPYQCGVARSLSRSPRIVGLQLQLGLVNVTFAELAELKSELPSTSMCSV